MCHLHFRYKHQLMFYCVVLQCLSQLEQSIRIKLIFCQCLLGPHVCVCGVNSHIKLLPGREKRTDPVTCNDAEIRRSRETRLLAVKLLLISVTS